MSIMIHFLSKFKMGLTPSRLALAAAAATTAVYMSVAGYKFYKRHKAHKKLLLQQEEAQKKIKEQESAFENKYFNEYDELKDEPEAPVPSATSHVRETTPQGDVIMTYDDSRKLFCYYSDKRTIQFKYLEPVARKYVIEHRCKRLYIDIRKELTKAKEAATTIATAPAPPKTHQVFAQLKKYTTMTTNKRALPTINEMAISNAISATSATTNNQILLKEQVTKYLYCGRLDEFNANEHPNEMHDFSIIKPIDYASFKKMNDA
jgi:hypothetical protein